jgi:hypothetical protein
MSMLAGHVDGPTTPVQMDRQKGPSARAQGKCLVTFHPVAFRDGAADPQSESVLTGGVCSS